MRRIRGIDYINRILNMGFHDFGLKLLSLYNRWKTSLSIQDFMEFSDYISSLLGNSMFKANFSPQMMGQFRAYSFEEYIYDLIASRMDLPSSMYNLLWNEKIPLWSECREVYESSFDIIILKRRDNKPKVVIEAKIDVDSPRLRIVLFNSLLLSKLYDDLYCYLVFINWNASSLLRSMALKFVDGVFNVSRHGQIEAFLNRLKNDLYPNIFD